MRDRKMRDRKTRDQWCQVGPKCSTGKCRTGKCGSGNCRTGNVGPGIQNKFHIYACVTDTSTSTSATSPTTEMCEVCLLVPRDGVALVLCGHARFCSACAGTVGGMGNGYPLCRMPTDMVLRVFSWDCNVFNVFSWIRVGTVRVYSWF